MTPWKRSEAFAIPQVWQRCIGQKEWNGGVLKYRVQDATEDMYDDIIQFMYTHYLRDETICQCLEIWKHPESKEEFRIIWRNALNEKCAVVALLDDDEGNLVTPRRIIGVNLTCVHTKEHNITSDMFSGYVTRAMMRDVLEYTSNIVNVFQKYGVDCVLTALGLCVDPEFRGYGVGLELLRVRKDLCKALGLKVTTTVFTGTASQKLGHKYGMELLAEVPYERFKKPDGSPYYQNVKCPSIKMMAKIFD